MERNIYSPIVDTLQSDGEISKYSSHGYCRDWVREAIKILKAYPEIGIEVREVDMPYGLQHTFLRIIFPDYKPFICDGIGVEKHPPFFGYEDEAPAHLQNSHLDIINTYLHLKTVRGN